MRILTLLCLGVVAIVAIASSAQASTSGPFTTSTPIGYALTDWSGSLSFPQFNSALGTLTEVDLTFNAGMETTLTITNDSDSGSSGSANTNVQISVEDPGDYFSPPAGQFLVAGVLLHVSGRREHRFGVADEHWLGRRRRHPPRYPG